MQRRQLLASVFLTIAEILSITPDVAEKKAKTSFFALDKIDGLNLV